MAAAQDADHRQNSFDALRLIAALMVHFGHQLHLMGRPMPMIGSHSIATVGLYIFFAMSGYLVTSSILRGTGPVDFVKSRFLRIWPALTFYLLFTVLAGYAFTSASLVSYISSPATLQYLVAHLIPGILVQVFQPSQDIPVSLAGPVWTIKYEIICYLIIMLSYLVPRRCLPLFLMALPLVGLVSFFLSPVEDGSTLYSVVHIQFVLGFLFQFGIGAALAYAVTKSPNAATAFLALAAFACAIFTQADFALQALIATLTLVIGISPVLCGYTRHFGDISFGVYLYSFPAIGLVLHTFPADQYPWVNLIAPLGIALALATLSWRFIERPALSLKRYPILTFSTLTLSNLRLPLVGAAALSAAALLVIVLVPKEGNSIPHVAAARVAQSDQGLTSLRKDPTIRATVDHISERCGGTKVYQGWAFSREHSQISIVAPGIASTNVSVNRPGIVEAFGLPEGTKTGFALHLESDLEAPVLLAVTEDGRYNEVQIWEKVVRANSCMR